MSGPEIFVTTCLLCPWTGTGETHRVAGCLSSWHVYEEHPEAWRFMFGDRPPNDPDPRTVWGKQQARAEAS